MNPLYQKALEGTLKSEYRGQPFTATITNGFPFPLRLSKIDAVGAHLPLTTIKIGGGVRFNSCPGYVYWLQNAWSGSFVAVLAPLGNVSTGGGTYTDTIDYRWLTLPNDIGALPRPTTDRLVPPNSTLVLIGYGTAPNGNVITREQYWLRQPDSFSLAAGESKTSSISVMRGLQDTSSESATVAGSLGVSGSAGWGPISASVSASLNASATVSHQVTVSEQTTAYESKTFTNQLPNSVMFLSWQLVDVITIYDKSTGEPLATMSSGEPPGIIDGPFNPDNIAPSEQFAVPVAPHEDVAPDVTET